MDFLIDFYSSEGKDGLTPESAISQERAQPNSTIDAARMVGTIDRLTRALANRRFLDVGCGYGVFSRCAIDAGFDVLPLELAENEREITRAQTGLDPVACTFETFESPPESFGVVFMSQVLEHAQDVNLWVGKACKLLVPGGILAVALPNFDSIFRRCMQENEPYIIPPAHLNFFTPKSLSLLMRTHGFQVEAVQWVSRIPRDTVLKRTPFLGGAAWPVVNAGLSAVMGTLDSLRLGMIINAYGRKHAA